MQKRNNNLSQQNKLYSLGKISLVSDSEDVSFEDEKYVDKIKIIEFCNCIDAWEQELLFADNGFYSLKGKLVEQKADDYIRELENFANSKIAEIKFSRPESKLAIKEIKKLKLNAISQEINRYKFQQLREWELNVYEDALLAAKNKAVLYKENDNIVKKTLNNALSVLNLMAEKENWEIKLFKRKKTIFLADFYKNIIESFISEKNINAVNYFEKFSNFLFDEDKEKLQQKIKNLKIHVIAYNWANEIFTYNLSYTDIEKEINSIKDNEIETSVRNFLVYLKAQKKKLEDEKNKNLNEKVWQEILNVIDVDKEKAFLCIDYSQASNSIKSQKKYIGQILKEGVISTDKSEFISILEEVFENLELFKSKCINDYRANLNKEDFELINSFLKFSKEKYDLLKADWFYLKEQAKSKKISSKNKLYEIFKIFYLERETKKNLKKDTDIEDINKLIECILLRYSEEKTCTH